MKKIVSLVIALVLVMSCVSASAGKLEDIQAAGKLVVGASVGFPPYEFYYDNPETGEEELQGFEMAMAKGLAEYLGVEFVLADQAFSGLITALRAGEIDCIISGMAIKPERLEVVDFSDTYFKGTQTMLIRTEDAEVYTTKESINGKPIAAQLGAFQMEIAEEQFPDSEVLSLDSVAIMVSELRSGNVDGVILTDTVSKSYASVFPDITISEMEIEYDKVGGVGVAIAQGDDGALMEKINEYLALVLEDGTFQQWLDEAYALNGMLLAAEEEAE